MKDVSPNDIKVNFPLTCRKDFERKVVAGGVTIGGEDLTIMAGPCTVESRTQMFEIAEAVSKAGATVMRGGVFKPLTFPYGDPLAQPDSDAGLPGVDRSVVLDKKDQLKAGEKRLAYFKEAADKFGLAVISEILYADTVEMMEDYVDMFQIGYRHMFNMDLIDALAKTEKPLMIKRHYGESLRSLFGVSEHFEARGKTNYVFCERGIVAPHTHNVESRAILDIQAIPAINEFAPTVPVIIDPSHSTFKRMYVAAMSRAAIAAGADGLLIEVHPQPEDAWVDPLQALGFEAFDELMGQMASMAPIVGRKLER